MDKQGRRSDARFSLASVVLVEGPGGTFYSVARNISAGGIFLETEQALPLGSVVRMTFEAPGGGANFVATGEVKHSVRFAFHAEQEQRSLRGVGIRFINFEWGELSSHALAC